MDVVLRYSFALLFILVAVKKFRLGIGGYAESLLASDALYTQELPSILLQLYGWIIPWAELLVGLMLLVNKGTLTAYKGIALIYLSFVFGQMYNLNTSKIGTEYFPSLIALSLAYYSHWQQTKRS